MSTTQPVRNLEELAELKNYYYEKEPNLRNYALISLGLNTALRISDLLQLKWNDIYDFEHQNFRQHILVTEHKTGKENRIALNQSAKEALNIYKKSLGDFQMDAFLFCGRNRKNMPLSRSQAYRIIRHASEALHMGTGISCHSMRKTFGYHAWKNGIPPIILMNIFNHSSYEVTKRYLGIDQDDKDSVFLEVNL